MDTESKTRTPHKDVGKMKVLDFVLVLSEGHTQLNAFIISAINVKYVEICGGSGPLFGINA